MKNITKHISHMAPCIEVIGYRQKKKGITSFGDLCSDFGANVKFLIGQKKKYKRINIGNLKTNIANKKIKHSVNGNTNTVYINPLNSLRFVLNELKKDKVNLDKDFLCIYWINCRCCTDLRKRSLHWKNRKTWFC